ncbi:uncharacterized protein KY384_005002 [Bacidia gigantensis]|uniref:uncharacterized protein n=1 Tax=Bacidia gigantensis TaxID=2732470 RepID=UPI001D041317|nr:uncharacterized protein KY384_005002 [Bacidia gigantensis]KAG8530499.1 hypothetical protein KY384_005002 [Bacidia gigantensis]
MAPYPTAHEIEEIFFHRINTEEFHSYLADHIDITVTGNDFNISGKFKSLEEFHNKIYVRINAAVKQETLRLEVNRVIGGGESPQALSPTAVLQLMLHRYTDKDVLQWAAVEVHYECESKEGRHLVYETVDLVRFNKEGKIFQMKSFLDSLAIHNLVEEHEKAVADGKREHGPVAPNAWAHTKDTPQV